MSCPVHKYTSKIRELINTPRIQHGLLKNQAMWNQLCSSLDVAEDTDLAIEAYSITKPASTNGEKYLILYGLLQSLVTQQDAVIHLCEALSFPINLEDFPKLQEVRNIRIESIGHPTKRNRKKKQPTSYHYITRISLQHDGFTLGSEYADGKSDHKYIVIPDLIAEQRKNIRKILKSVIKELTRKDNDHKKEFMMKKLVSAFPDTLSYYFEKIYEAIGKPEIIQLGRMHIGLVRQCLVDFEKLIIERNLAINTYNGVEYLWNEIQYPLKELKTFFEDNQKKATQVINEQTARIFLYFMQEKILELKKVAQGIDEEYAS